MFLSMIFGVSFGVFMLLFGLPYYKLTLLVSSLVSSLCTLLIILYFFFLPYETPLWIGWLVIIGSVIKGTLFGTMFAKMSRIGVFFVGMMAGAIVIGILYVTILHSLIVLSPILFHLFVSGCSILGGVLILMFFPYSYAASTSIIGAYSIM